MLTENDVEWTWFIRRVKVKSSNGELNDILHSITWTLEAEYIDPSDKEHYVRDFSSTTVLPEVTDTSNFIEYDSLQKETLISWIIENEGDKLTENKQKTLAKLNRELGNSEEEEYSGMKTRVINFE